MWKFNYIMVERMLKLITLIQQMVVSSEWGKWMQIVFLFHLGDVARVASCHKRLNLSDNDPI
jgi:hypothetical protein